MIVVRALPESFANDAQSAEAALNHAVAEIRRDIGAPASIRLVALNEATAFPPSTMAVFELN